MTWEPKSRKGRQGYMSVDVGRGEGREGTAKLLLGRIPCLVGLHFGGVVSCSRFLARAPTYLPGPWGQRWVFWVTSSA
jgi:hypothetical protein